MLYDDLLLRTGVELEKILTFIGFTLPNRRALQDMAKQLRNDLQVKYTVMSSNIGDDVLHVAVEALQDELRATECLSKYVLVYI